MTVTIVQPDVLEASPAPPRELLTILEACARARVSRRTIYHWLAKGKLAYCRTAGGSVRIYADSLLQPEKWAGLR